MPRKQNVLVVLLMIWQALPTTNAKYSVKFTKVECDGTLQTATEMFCNIKNLKKVSTINFGYTLNREIGSNGLVMK